MMRGDPYKKKKKLWWKLAALAGLATVFAAVTVCLQRSTGSIEQSGKVSGEQILKATVWIKEMGVPLGSGDNVTVEEDGESDTAETHIPILNLAEYASPSMGEDAVLLEQRLYLFMQEQQMSAATADIVHVMIPRSDPECTYYYVRIHDEAETLCLLSYHPREHVVTASACSYTLGEVLSESFEDNAPEQRDISPEEEAAFIQSQEAAGGETPQTEGTVPEGEVAPEQPVQEGENET